MLSFFGDQGLKNAVVERVQEHQRLDQILQGKYWEQCDDGVFRGCGIGCVTHSSDHMDFERLLQLPVALAYLYEHIFESLPGEDANAWPLRFIQAVPVGVDLDLVLPKFVHWILADPDGIRRHADAATRPIIGTLTGMYARRIAGEPFNESAAESAARAARSAAWRAAEMAAIDRQADKLVEILESYESQPILAESILTPCAERYAFL